MSSYPSVARRYFATVVDLVVSIALVTLLAKTLTAFGLYGGYYWVAVFSPFFLYEPVLTGFSATVGQRLFRFRVNSSATGRPIGLFRSYARLLVKYFLGLISLLLIPADPQRRAIHDKWVGSVVVNAAGPAEVKAAKSAG